MKSKIIDIVANYNPKSFGKIVKRNKDLHQWLIDNTPSVNTENISERIFVLVNGDVIVGECGKRPSFESFTKGYRQFCGPTNTCECAKKSVSEKVKKTKSMLSPEEIAISNKKREETSLIKYGVLNNAQTETARINHKIFYDNNELVNKQVSKHKATMMEKYGVDNPMKIADIAQKAGQTWKERYANPDYWSERMNNDSFHVLFEKDQLEELLKTLSPTEIADKLSVHPQTIYKYLGDYGLRDRYKSFEEKQIVNFVKSLYNEKIVENSRSILPSNKELDIFIPELKLAIEYNGIYWHHIDIPHISKSYHYDKFKECHDMGITLITIFSSEWKSKQTIVKKIIKNKIGTEKRIHGRRCTVRKISNKDTIDFINSNHIKGYSPASTCYALYYENEMVAVMTFSKPRMGIGKNEKNSVEMVRFCTSIGINGGASKLLSAFAKDCPGVDVISYSDNEWGDGSVYEKLGFSLDSEVKPGYWYVRPREEKMIHRLNYTKNKLVKMGYDATLSESEITRSLGFLRIYDCGKKKWIKRL